MGFSDHTKVGPSDSVAVRMFGAGMTDNSADMRALRRLLRTSVAEPLSIHLRGAGAAIAAVVEDIARGQRVHDDDLAMAIVGQREIRAGIGVRFLPSSGGRQTAVVPMYGVINLRLEAQPYATSTLMLAQNMRSLASDPAIDGIILDCSSPGGTVTGVPECSDAIRAAAQKKTVIAYTADVMASAAYWLCSQASVIIASESADVGSIGVFMAHTDCSKMMSDMGVKTTYIHAGKNKVEANSTEPLAEEAKGYIQSQIDSIYQNFKADVARGRGITTAEVEARFKQGRCVFGSVAARIGMVDKVGDFGLAFNMATSPGAARRARIDRLSAPVSERDHIIAARHRRIEILRRA
jgi:signal peptide peptidase SppA